METKNETSVAVKNISFKLGKRSLTLTIDEAQKLKAALNELFGKEIIVKEEHHHHDSHPIYPWYWKYDQPIYSTGATWSQAGEVLTRDIGVAVGDAHGLTTGGALKYELKKNTVQCSFLTKPKAALSSNETATKVG